jgi:hypothetical protein
MSVGAVIPPRSIVGMRRVTGANTSASVSSASWGDAAREKATETVVLDWDARLGLGRFHGIPVP